jgi:hypothetical protein
MAAQLPVLGVLPGSLLVGKPFGPAGEKLNSAFSVDATIDEEIAVGLIVNDGAGSRVKITGVADGVSVKVEVVIEEKPHIPVLVPQVQDLDLLQVHVLLEIYRVTAVELQAEALVLEGYVGDQAVFPVPKPLLPFGPHPGESAVHPDSKRRRVALRMVFLADEGEIDIAKAVVGVKIDKERAVTDRNVFGHSLEPRD